jgi:hypothetical protein
MELRARLAMGLCSLVHQHLQCVGLYSLMTERECPWQHIDRRLAYEVHTTQPHALNINTLDLKNTVLFQFNFFKVGFPCVCDRRLTPCLCMLWLCSL